MDGLKQQIDDLAKLVTEFGLEEANLKGKDWEVELRLEPKGIAAAPAATSRPRKQAKPKPKVQSPTHQGTPVTSPMTGIWYSSPSPGSPPFAKVGSVVNAGDVIGLIEAMKVFNEITAPVSGTVTECPIENSQLVQPGEALIYIS